MSLLHEAEQTETVLFSSATRSFLNGPSFNAGTCFQTQNFRLQALLLLELGSHVRRKGDKPVCSSTCLTVEEKFCCGVSSEVRSAPLIQFLPLAITPSLPVFSSSALSLPQDGVLRRMAARCASRDSIINHVYYSRNLSVPTSERLSLPTDGV